MKPLSAEEIEREKWLEEIRAALRRTYGLPGTQGRVSVRARAEELRWLREQLEDSAMSRLDLFVAPENEWPI